MDGSSSILLQPFYSVPGRMTFKFENNNRKKWAKDLKLRYVYGVRIDRLVIQVWGMLNTYNVSADYLFKFFYHFLYSNSNRPNSLIINLILFFRLEYAVRCTRAQIPDVVCHTIMHIMCALHWFSCCIFELYYNHRFHRMLHKAKCGWATK